MIWTCPSPQACRTTELRPSWQSDLRRAHNKHKLIYQAEIYKIGGNPHSCPTQLNINWSQDSEDLCQHNSGAPLCTYETWWNFSFPKTNRRVLLNSPVCARTQLAFSPSARWKQQQQGEDRKLLPRGAKTCRRRRPAKEANFRRKSKK